MRPRRSRALLLTGLLALWTALAVAGSLALAATR